MDGDRLPGFGCSSYHPTDGREPSLADDRERAAASSPTGSLRCRKNWPFAKWQESGCTEEQVSLLANAAAEFLLRPDSTLSVPSRRRLPLSASIRVQYRARGSLVITGRFPPLDSTPEADSSKVQPSPPCSWRSAIRRNSLADRTAFRDPPSIAIGVTCENQDATTDS